MVRKLRKKFVLINMIFVMTILCVVMAVVLLFSFRRFQTEGEQALNNMLAAQTGDVPSQLKLGEEEEEEPGFLLYSPSFLIYAGEQVTIELEEGIDVSCEQAEQIASHVLKKKEVRGVIPKYHLMYQMIRDNNVDKIACVYFRYEREKLHTLLIICLLILSAVGAVFVILNFFVPRWAIKPVEKAWEQQRQFTANASHELKTPLTVILANLDILSAHKEERIADQWKWLNSTKEEAERMKELVENLLFLARSDAEGLSEPMEELNMSDLAWNSILTFESIAFERQIGMVDEIAPDIRMQGNAVRIKQLFAILLDNACKYAGRDGLVTVRLMLQQDRIQIEVENTGEVISEQELVHVFERFYRTDKSRARKEGGYGLGLSIAKTIVENHRGKIKAESSPEKGTVFTIHFFL